MGFGVTPAGTKPSPKPPPTPTTTATPKPAAPPAKTEPKPATPPAAGAPPPVAAAPKPKTEPKPGEPAPVVPAPVPARESPEWKEKLAAQAKIRADQQKVADDRRKLDDDLKRVAAYEKALAEAKKTGGRSLLRAAGITYDELTAAELAGDATPEQIALEETRTRLAAIEDARKKEADAQAELEKKQAHQTTQAALASLAKQAEGMAEKYPLIAALKRGPAVARAIWDHYEKTGEVPPLNADGTPDITTFCDALEKDLDAALPGDLDRLVSSPAMRERLKAALTKAEAGTAPAPRPRAAPKTKDKAPEDETPVERRPPERKMTSNQRWQEIRRRRAEQSA